MRILMVTASMDRGGAETHVRALGEGLTNRGHRVILASGGGREAERWIKQGGRHLQIPLGRTPTGLLCSADRILRLLRRERVDLIHVHGRLAGMLCAPLGRWCDVPVVSTVHARFPSGRWDRFCRWGQGAIAVSQDLKQYLCQHYGYPSERVTVIPNGIDTDRFRPGNGRGRRRVVFLSRLDGDCSRGALLLCQVAPALWRQFPDLQIQIGGGGTMGAAVRERVRVLQRRFGTERIVFLGSVERTEKLLQDAVAVLGVSRVALEAMACGVPVILGGDEGWLGLLTEDKLRRGEETNFCCRGEEPMTKERLLSALREVLSLSDAEGRRLGARLRTYVLRHHGQDAMAEATETFYGRWGIRRKDGREKVLLCGYYGFGNMGDDALLRGAILAAQGEGASALALTQRGRRDSDRFGVPCIGRFCPARILRALGRVDRLVLGGGTLLQENTSRRSLFYYTWLMSLARRRGIPVELWANGLEPPVSRWGRKRMRSALMGCRRLTLRDRRSLEIGRALLAGRDAPIPQIGQDLAMGTRPCDSDRLAYFMRVYGLSPGDFLLVAPRGGGDPWCLSALCRRVEKEGRAVLLVPMFPKEDLALCLRLAEKWHCPVAKGLGAEDLVGLMGCCREVYGMRLHALVFALCGGASFTGFGNEGKLRSFCGEHGAECLVSGERKGKFSFKDLDFLGGM